jgi:hypothetical protein
MDPRDAWNPRHIAAVSALWVFPAAVLHALNYGRLGRPELTRPTLVRNLVVALLAYAVVPFIAVGGPDWPIVWALLVNAVGAVYFQRSQAILYAKHIGRGGERASVVGPALGLFGLFAVAFLFLVLVASALD